MAYADQLVKSLGPGHEGWEVIPGSLTKEPPKVSANPKAGQPRLGGGTEPDTIEVPSTRWQIAFSTPGGQNRTAYLQPGGGKDPDDPNTTLWEVDWRIVEPPADIPKQTSAEEQNARVAEAEAQAATAKSNSEIAAANLKKVQEDTREREYNQSQGNGYLTHDEVRKVQQDAAANNLSQQQIDARKQEIENNNRNSAHSNEIAALNANTAAANASSTAQATTARIKYEEGQLGLADAQFEHTKSQDEIAQRNIEAKQQLDQLQQQQANEIAQQTLGQRQVEGAETARNNAALLAQRQAEQAQAAQQAQATLEGQQQQTAVQAATSLYGNERQAQTAAGTIGGNLLSNRATAANNLLNNILGGAAGMSQGSAGRYGTLGGGLHAMPAGFDATQMLQGIQGYTAGQFGGQDTLDAAAAMVRGAAPGAELTPEGQSAIAVIQQAFERHHQLSGQPAGPVAAAAAARQSAANGGMAAPVSASYTVPISGPNGPGFMRVNANDPTAAAINANQGGNYATGTPVPYTAPVTVPL